MLRRKPTRLELKPEDKEEYDEAKRRAAAAARASSTAGPAASALLDHHPRAPVNQRIGLYK
uniref:Anaphase-promoting complex subunit CDC26 n=1 Tax=Physcomitrium patens TaxID=3218 RepID=A0A7I3ZNK7_PHYPA